MVFPPSSCIRVLAASGRYDLQWNPRFLSVVCSWCGCLFVLAACLRCSAEGSLKMRPRRKRKLTNYGEGHLHWIEESQLQKALIKSLREKSGNPRTSSENDQTEDIPSPSKMPRLSVSVGITPKTNMKCSVNIKDIMEPKKLAKSRKIRDIEKKDIKTRVLRSQRRGEESHALMMQPRNSDSNSKDSKLNSRSSKPPESEPDTPSKSGALLPRAQRKFASNASPPNNVRRSARFEAKLKRSELGSSVHFEDEKISPISDETLPETKDFLDYLCFRNTPLEFELDD